MTEKERNILGRYRTGRRVRVPDGAGLDDLKLGRVYEGLNRVTGGRALVSAPHAEGDATPAAPWRLTLEATTTPAPAFALEVDQAPAGPEQLEQVLLGLDVAYELLDRRAARDPQALQHLLSPRCRMPWRRRAERAAVVVAVVVFGACAAVSQVGGELDESDGPVPVGIAEDAAREQPEPGRVAERSSALARNVPSQPSKGQARPNAQGSCGRGETVINGGCWVGLKNLEPPCGDAAFEHDGVCYYPVMNPRREPSAEVPRQPGPAAIRR